MAKLSKAETKEIAKVLDENGLFQMVNNYLRENNLEAFELKSLQLIKKELSSGEEATIFPFLPCSNPVQVCTISGICKWVCP